MVCIALQTTIKQYLAHGLGVNMPVNQFMTAAKDAGILLNGHIIVDGVLHRSHIEGHRAGTKNGAYVLHLDGVPAGWAMDYKTGYSFTWRQDGSKAPLSTAQLEQIRQAKAQRQAEIEAQHKATAQKAKELWKKAIYADSSNQYAYRKNIQAHGTKRFDSGSLKDHLIVPVYDNAELVNLQFIAPDGQKRFMSGGKKKGCYFDIGADTDAIIICEGLADGASLFEAYGYKTFVAFDAGNLKEVALLVRAKYPTKGIIICGDNDVSGVGQAKAREAAIACGGNYSIPPVTGMDYNDYLNSANATAQGVA